MDYGFEKLNKLFPDKIVYNISQYPDLYHILSCEAEQYHKSLRDYLSAAGYVYGNNATILRLEAETERAIKSLGQSTFNASILMQNHIYNDVRRITTFYGITIKEYFENIGYHYVKQATNESNIDFDTAKILRDKFNFTLTDIGDIVGVSKQRIEQILIKGKATAKTWRTSDFSNFLDTFIYMLKNHLFEFHDNEVRYIYRHNLSNEMCFVWYDEVDQSCAYGKDIPEELQAVARQEKMDVYFTEDYDVLEDAQTVNRLLKPCLKITDTKLFYKACKLHKLTNEDYAHFLGYEGYVTDRDKNIDRRFIEFFEENLIDGEVYISADPSNQWIKSFASRNGMSIDKFVQLYGYRKAGRGKFATLEEYIDKVKEGLIEELNKIAVDGKVQPQGDLYQRLYIFAKKNSLSLDELIKKLGFERKRERNIEIPVVSQKTIKNDLDELNSDIENAMKFEREFSETEEKQVHIIDRNMNLVTRLKKIYGYKCQLCTDNEWMPIKKEDGTFYVEVHHIIPLAEGKDEDSTLDVLKNMIVVCPNHHKMLHYHLGGYKQIIREDSQLFFANGKGDKIPIIDNYHLEETHSK
jgi:predicted HNH restriction endonuclease/transcriptional regulator with XRE-family HTH domain